MIGQLKCLKDAITVAKKQMRLAMLSKTFRTPCKSKITEMAQESDSEVAASFRRHRQLPIIDGAFKIGPGPAPGISASVTTRGSVSLMFECLRLKTLPAGEPSPTTRRHGAVWRESEGRACQ